jgi:hypothetical protein
LYALLLVGAADYTEQKNTARWLNGVEEAVACEDEGLFS